MSWRGLDHRTIYEMVVNGGQGPGMSMEAERRWANIQKTITDAEHGIAAAVRDSDTEWEGSGADAMRSAYTPFGAWALNAAVSAHVTATGVRGQAELAMNTRMHVADNAPPQNFFEYLHDQVGSWDGNTVYDEQAAAVDRLMVDYESASVDNESRFDNWSVPPTVVVTPAVAGSPGPGGAAVAPLPDGGGVEPAGGGGSPIASALAPGAPGVGGGTLPTGAAAPAGGMASGGVGGGAGGGTGPAGVSPVPGVAGSPTTGTGGGTGAAAPGAAGLGAGGATTGGAAGRTTGAAGPTGMGPTGTGPSGTGPTGTGSGAGVAPGSPGRGAAGPGTGGVARPAQRPPGSSGGRGTGPGPWTRAATGAGGSPAAATPFRPVVPAVPSRTSTPDWRSVLLPPEREAPASTRTPGETAARPAGPGASGGSTTAPAAAQGSGPRGAGSPGMHGAPMMGGGAGGAQPEGRRRASYLIDDSDAFVDKRWFTEPVITPDDPL